MFDVGFAELVLLFVIGLLVLGPERLPKVAAEIGKWVGRARRTATQLRRQLEREVELNEVIQPPRPVARPSTPAQQSPTAGGSVPPAPPASAPESPSAATPAATVSTEPPAEPTDRLTPS